MYLKINKFLLAHEDLNMSKVPGFFQFFYSADFQVRLPRRSGGAGPRAACGGGRHPRCISGQPQSAPRGAPVTVSSPVSGSRARALLGCPPEPAPLRAGRGCPSSRGRAGRASSGAEAGCRVPGARALTASVSAQHHAEREWLFGLLRQGMRDKHCYALYARRGVLPVVLAFFSSPLCGPAAQVGAAPSLRPSVCVCICPRSRRSHTPNPTPSPRAPEGLGSCSGVS